MSLIGKDNGAGLCAFYTALEQQLQVAGENPQQAPESDPLSKSKLACHEVAA